MRSQERKRHFQPEFMRRIGAHSYKVIVVEDNEGNLSHLDDTFREMGHEIVGSAGSISEARALFNRVSKLKPDAALFDGTLDADEKDAERLTSGADGKQLYYEFKARYPQIPVIPYTGGKDIQWGDTPLDSPGAKTHRASKSAVTVASWITSLVEGNTELL